MILMVKNEEKYDFIVTEVLNTGKSYIYTLKSQDIIAKFKIDFKKWKFMEKVTLSFEQFEKEAYQLIWTGKDSTTI